MIKNHTSVTKKKKGLAITVLTLLFGGLFMMSGVLAEDVLSTEDADVPIGTEENLTSLTWPVPSAISVSLTFSEEGDEGDFYHNGVDIPAEKGADVVAAIDATIVSQGFDREKGNYLILEGDRYIVEYRHLLDFALTAGTKVKEGDVVATVGATGMATGPHLHFTLMEKDGDYLNPLEYSKEWDFERVQKALEEQEQRNERRRLVQDESVQ